MEYLKKILKRVLLIKKSAARIAVSVSKYHVFTPILKKLHWLPVYRRIQLTFLLMLYNAVNVEALEYLCDLLSIRPQSRVLRSCSQLLLQVALSRRKTYGDCAFCVAGSILWNGIPKRIRKSSSLENVKSSLKTYPFKVAFLLNKC